MARDKKAPEWGPSAIGGRDQINGVNKKTWPKESRVSGKPEAPPKWPSIAEVRKVSAYEWKSDWY